MVTNKSIKITHKDVLLEALIFLQASGQFVYLAGYYIICENTIFQFNYFEILFITKSLVLHKNAFYY